MKLVIRESEDVFGMSNISPRKSGLPCVIWLDDQGINRKVSHHVPRVKINSSGYWISVSISNSPKILRQDANIPHSVMKDMKKGIDYVSRNYDLLLKYNNDTDFSYDIEELYKDLRSRGELR